jgi:hypothetical protein
MRSFYILLLFFLSLNLSSALIASLQLLPVSTITFAEPLQIQNFLNIPSLAILGVGVAVGLFAHNPGITIASLILFALNAFVPFGNWVIGGLPVYLGLLGVPSTLVTGLQILFQFVWFMAFINILRGGSVNEY